MIQLLLWSLGIPAAIVLTMVACVAVEWAVWHLENASARCQSRFAGWRVRATREALHEQDWAAFLHWLRARTGTDQMSGFVDESLIEAQQQSELIHILVEGEVPKAISQ